MVSPLIFVFVLNDNGTWTFWVSASLALQKQSELHVCFGFKKQKNSSKKNLHNKNSIPHVAAYTQRSCSLCQCCFCEGNLIRPTVNAENVSTDSLLVCHQTEFRLRIEVHDTLQYIAAVWYQAVVSKNMLSALWSKYIFSCYMVSIWCVDDSCVNYSIENIPHNNNNNYIIMHPLQSVVYKRVNMYWTKSLAEHLHLIKA